MNETTTVKFSDVAELSGGYAFKSEQYTANGHFVLRTVNIREDYSIDSNGGKFISEQDAKNYERFALRAHDTLFVMVGATLGKIGYVRVTDLPALLNQNMWVIRAIPGKIDPLYLHYCFRELSKIPLAWASGSARGFLRRDDIRNLEFQLPSLTEQRAAGEVLRSLDDKIDLNRRINSNLEATASATFRDWFIDFGPTRAKLEGHPPYLMSEIWSQFPDQLDSEGKPIGWKLQPLSSIAKLANDAVTPTSFPDELFDHYSIPAFDNGKRPVREAGENILSNKTVVLPDAVLVSKLNPETLRVWLVERDSAVRSICSTEFLVVSALSDTNRPFIYSLLVEDGFRQRLTAMVTGTSSSHQRISPSSMMALNVVTGAPGVMEAFNKVSAPLLDRCILNHQEARTLAEMRDLILPRLVSGEIRVKDAEQLVGVAT